MADLKRVNEQLKLNNENNMAGHEEVKSAVDGVSSSINSLIRLMKQSALDKLEADRETKKQTSKISSAKSSGDSFGIPPGLFGAGAIIPVITALGASLAGLDDALRAIKLIEIGKNLNAGALRLATRIENFLGSMKVVALKFDDFGRNLLKVVFIPEEGVKALGQQIYKIFGLGVDGKPVVGTSEAMKALYNPQKALANAIKPITTFFDDLVKPVTTFIDGAKEAGPMKAIGSLFAGIAGLTKFIPRIDFTALKAVIGSAEDATGIVGFFSGIFNFIRPLLKPFEFVLKTVMRPFTQILLSVVDFVVGFYKGFSAEDGSFFEKLTAGIEGGIEGVIKGFTEAIDLIFFKLPAWIAGKLGFEGLSEQLKELNITQFVEPAVEGVKNFFKNLFNDPAGTLGSTVMGAADVVNDFIKSVLRSILPIPDPNGNWYDPANLASKAIPKFVYDYAGIDKETGAIIPEPPQIEAAPEVINPAEMRSPSRSSTVVVNNAPSSTVNNTSSSSSAMVMPHVAAQDFNDPYELAFAP